MLVLARRKGEEIVITDGTETIRLRVTRTTDQKARIGIEASEKWRIVRAEVEEQEDAA